MRNPTSITQADWLIPGALIALTLVPMAGGAFRLLELGRGAGLTPDNARFFAAPLPVALHIVSAVGFCLLGALQFAPGFRRQRPDWHRVAGRVLVPLGLVAALSGLWLAPLHVRGAMTGPQAASYDSAWVLGLRLVAGAAMAGALGLGVRAAVRRDFARHRAWMIRGYALALGAGTQVFTHLPWFLWPELRGEPMRAFAMGAGWGINAVVAEWLIVRGRRRRSSEEE